MRINKNLGKFADAFEIIEALKKARNGSKFESNPNDSTYEQNKRTMEIFESYDAKFEMLKKELYSQRIILNKISSKLFPETDSNCFTSSPTLH